MLGNTHVKVSNVCPFLGGEGGNRKSIKLIVSVCIYIHQGM